MKPLLVLLLSICTGIYACAGDSTVNDKKEKSLRGTWVLDSSQITPAFMPSFCHNLFPGSRFVFHDNTFDVFPRDSATKCNWMTLDYRIDKEGVTMSEDDMVMHMDIVKLTSDRLVLRSTYFDHQKFAYSLPYEDSVLLEKGMGYEMYFRRESEKK